MMIRLISKCVILVCCSLSLTLWAKDTDSPINALLGDRSFVERFGRSPHANTSEQLRITTHLAYVEGVLRRKDASHLSSELRNKRFFLLDKLREYRIIGRFPRNYSGSKGRKPCFIDKHGNICAVGYLFAQSAGYSLAERINNQHQYDEIKDMNMPELTEWVAASGLTLEECAMIQPGYSSVSPIPTEYAVASGALNGFNIALGVVNTEQIVHGSNAKIAPILGAVSGITSVLLGSLNLHQEVRYWGPVIRTGLEPSQVLNPISVANIGFGAASIILSAWNFISDTPVVQSQATTLHLYTAPMPQEQVSMGLRLRFTF
jgi:hypothetical protein